MPGASCDAPGILLLAGPGLALGGSATGRERNWAGAQLGRSEELIPYRGSTTTFWKAPWPAPT